MSIVVCHLFVVRLPNRSAVCRQALCVVSGEASANFERPSRNNFFLDSRQQVFLVYLITRPLQRCVCFYNWTQIDFTRSPQSRPSHCCLGSERKKKKKMKKRDQASELPVVVFVSTSPCREISREVSCVFSSLIV